MEGRLVLGSSSSPFISAVSPPHSICGLSQSRPLLDMLCGSKSGRLAACSSQVVMLMCFFR